MPRTLHYFKERVCQVALVMFNSVQCYELQPVRFLSPRDSPDKNTGVGCYTLLQGIFLIQRLNLCLFCLLHWQAGSSPLAPREAQAFQTGVIQVVSNHHCYLCSSADQALQVMGFRAYADHHKTKQHQSQVEQEENQKVHPGSTKEHKERDCY